MMGKIKKIITYGFVIAHLGTGTSTGCTAIANQQVVNQQEYIRKNSIEIQTQESKEEVEDAKKVLDELINSYLEIDSGLSEEEIKESLKHVGFIDLNKLNIQDLYIKKPYNSFSERDISRNPIEEAISSGELLLKDDYFNIVQVDFFKLGVVPSYVAFYDWRYNAIFIDKKQKTKDDVTKNIYKDALFLEYKERDNKIYHLHISGKEKARKIESLMRWFEKMNKKIKKMDKETDYKYNNEIYQFILKHKEKLKGEIKELQVQETIEKILIKKGLPHEAFHYFYETKLGEEGYSGPGVDKLLSLALLGIHKRFGSQDPSYAFIMDFIKGIDLNDKEKVNQFSKEITKKYDLTSPPRDYSSEEWEKLSDEEIDNYFLHKTLYIFLNEYWARVYNGACGNTPESIESILGKTASKLGISLPKYDLKDMFYKPFKQELEVIRQMKWKGKPILK